jgi:hypothetical protein
MPTRNIQDGILTIKDGAGTPASVVVTLEDSGLRWTEQSPVKEIDDREVLSHMRPGKQQSVRLRLSLKFVEFIKQTGGSDPTFYEAVMRMGAAAAWTSTNDDNGDVYTTTWEFLIVSPDPTEDDELITFAKVAVVSRDFQEGSDYNTLEAEAIDYETKPAIAKQVKS